MKIPNSIYHFIAPALICISLFTSCEKEDSTVYYNSGVYISNEGGWGNSDGSLSFYEYSSDKVYNNIFQKKNNRPLGDVVQSVAISSASEAFIVVNSSNKIEIAYFSYSFLRNVLIAYLQQDQQVLHMLSNCIKKEKQLAVLTYMSAYNSIVSVPAVSPSTWSVGDFITSREI